MSLKEYLFKILEQKYATTTARNRVSFLLKLAPKDATNLSFLKDLKYIKRRIDEYENVSTKANNLNHIVKTIDALNQEIKQTLIPENIVKFYKEWLDELFKQKELKRQNNVKTEDDKEGFKMNIDELQTVLDTQFKQFNNGKTITKAYLTKLTKEGKLVEFLRLYQKLVLLSCYVYQPALRNDWGSIIILTNLKKQNNQQNFIYLGKKKSYIIMNDYKTSKKYGTQIIDLDKRLVKVLNKWISIYKNTTQQNPYYILYYNIDINGLNHNDPASLSMIIKRASNEIFNIDYSINDYRKGWTKKFIEMPNYMKLTKLEKNKLHMKLLHSTEIAEQDYIRV